ncbi:MAG: hypothetical protein JSS32_07060 [Verrucomicrobia bacterium]|nr:hypothetical protein [Verrucomicrobiota bacterium]
MKSKIFSALLMLLPFTQMNAFIDDDDGEVLDQFMLTMGSNGYMLCKAIDMARDSGYRYVKVLTAEYTIGNQSGGFTCQLDNDDEEGELLHYQDETFKMTLSCLNFTPADTDYMDTEIYQDILGAFDDDDDDDDWN